MGKSQGMGDSGQDRDGRRKQQGFAGAGGRTAEGSILDDVIHVGVGRARLASAGGTGGGRGAAVIIGNGLAAACIGRAVVSEIFVGMGFELILLDTSYQIALIAPGIHEGACCLVRIPPCGTVHTTQETASEIRHVEGGGVRGPEAGADRRKEIAVILLW